MLHKTRGIVFHVTDYSETSVVAKIYTRLFGIQSYLIKGAKRRHSRIHSNILQPMSLLEMEVYHKDRGGLQHVSEMSNEPVFKTIPADMMKSSMVLFINEVVYKSVKEEEANPVMFDFIHHSMQWLDAMEPVNPDFHLIFLVQFTRYLGFFPHGKFSESEPVFDLMEGRFQSSIPQHPYSLEGQTCKWLSALLSTSLQQKNSPGIDSETRRHLVDGIMEYYGLHISGFGNLKSHKVLEAVWS